MAEQGRRSKKAAVRKAVGALFRRYENLTGKTFETLMILGHMRSGSTLLHHILISHPDLLGSGERNAYYYSPEDLAMLRLRVLHDRRRWLRFPRYAVDQINHDKFTPNPALLATGQVKCIFLLREPRASVSSLLRVLAPIYGFGLERAIDHYTDRLAGLARLASALTDSKQVAFLTYDDLINETDRTLSGLTRFLGLERELQAEYETFGFTGKRGDPGEKIGLGKIARVPSEPVELPSAELRRIEAAYSQCLGVISQRHPRLSSLAPDTR